MMRLIFTEGALADFESILNYIAKDSHSAAVRFGEGLIETCELLEKNPELWVNKDDLNLGLRLFTYRGYGLYYRIDDQRQALKLLRVLYPALDVRRQSFE